MAQKLVINADNVEDLLTGYGAGARIEVERSAVGGGVSFAQIVTVPLVAGVEQYEYWDTTGGGTDFYRTRYTTSAGAIPSAWSPEFRAGATTAYATLDALREYMGLPDHTKDNLLSDLLIAASAWIDDKCQRDFLRHPQVAGTETRLISPSSQRLIELDIVSLTQAEVAAVTGASYVAMAASDWVLEPAGTRLYRTADGGQAAWPRDELTISDVSGYPRWPAGFATVRLTGVFGWPAVPALIQKATLDIAREWYRQGPGGGGPVGVNQFGTPLFLQGMPRSASDAVATYGRHWGIA